MRLTREQSEKVLQCLFIIYLILFSSMRLSVFSIMFFLSATWGTIIIFAFHDSAKTNGELYRYYRRLKASVAAFILNVLVLILLGIKFIFEVIK